MFGWSPGEACSFLKGNRRAMDRRERNEEHKDRRGRGEEEGTLRHRGKGN